MIGSERQALQMTGVARSTWHYRAKPRPRVANPIPHRERACPSRISHADRALVAGRVTASWQAGTSVDAAFASAWDTGMMVASKRSWWRIAAAMKDQSSRPLAPTRRASRTPRAAPVLIATGPNQVWSWDITDLATPWRGSCLKAYSIIDIYSRKLVGYRVEDREVDALAVEMFATAIKEHGTPGAVHADSGAAMRSTAMKLFLAKHNINQTHNRPRVSNDNPFSESEFRTMKCRPNYPGIFDNLEDGRAFMDRYVPWYNNHHHHSGIALFTPNQVHDGSWRTTWTIRDSASQHYYNRHPERFRRRPTTATPATTVGINMPKTDEQRLQTA